MGRLPWPRRFPNPSVFLNQEGIPFSNAVCSGARVAHRHASEAPKGSSARGGFVLGGGFGEKCCGEKHWGWEGGPFWRRGLPPFPNSFSHPPYPPSPSPPLKTKPPRAVLPLGASEACRCATRAPEHTAPENGNTFLIEENGRIEETAGLRGDSHGQAARRTSLFPHSSRTD